jgi:hypothetical protein
VILSSISIESGNEIFVIENEILIDNLPDSTNRRCRRQMMHNL